MSTRVWFSLLSVLMVSLAHTQVNEIKTLTGEIINKVVSEVEKKAAELEKK